MAVKGTLDAISAAMDAVTESPEPAEAETEPVEPQDEPEVTDAQPAEAPEEQAPEASAEEGGKPAEIGSVKQTDEEKAAAEAAAALAAKKPLDPVNDPIPATVAPRTKERIEKLIGTNKELETRAAKAEAEHKELFGAIQAVGATPEQFASMLDFMRLANSDSLEDRRQLFNTLKNELLGLAKEIGEPAPGEDAVASHQDLAAAVQAGQITPELAREIAATRSRTSAATQYKQKQELQTKEQQAVEQSVNLGKTALTALGKQLAASDPDFERKRAILVPALKPVLENLPPEKWAQAFHQAYQSLVLPAAPAPVVPASTPQPLRANKTPAGNPAGKPKNIHEAIWGAK